MTNNQNYDIRVNRSGCALAYLAGVMSFMIGFMWGSIGKNSKISTQKEIIERMITSPTKIELRDINNDKLDDIIIDYVDNFDCAGDATSRRAVFFKTEEGYLSAQQIERKFGKSALEQYFVSPKQEK